MVGGVLCDLYVTHISSPFFVFLSRHLSTRSLNSLPFRQRKNNDFPIPLFCTFIFSPSFFIANPSYKIKLSFGKDS